MKKGLTFRQKVIIQMPYILLKFLIQEKELTKFLDKSNEHHSFAYLNNLDIINARLKCGDFEIVGIISATTLLKAAFTTAFLFNDYWHRRFWKFEEFVKEYEKKYSK